MPKVITWDIPGLTERFIELYKGPERYSLGIISRMLSEEFCIPLTRNACIGKSHRLDLSSRERPLVVLINEKPRHTIKRKYSPLPRISKHSSNIYELPRPERSYSGSLPLLELGRDDCRWPVSDEPLLWCAKQAQSGSSFCSEHHKRCYSRS